MRVKSATKSNPRSYKISTWQKFTQLHKERGEKKKKKEILAVLVCIYRIEALRSLIHNWSQMFAIHIGERKSLLPSIHVLTTARLPQAGVASALGMRFAGNGDGPTALLWGYGAAVGQLWGCLLLCCALGWLPGCCLLVSC